VSAIFAERNPLGSPSKSARTRFTRRLPGAAAPALLGVAAAVAAASTPAAALAATQAPAHHTAAKAAVRLSGLNAGHLLSVTRPAAKHTSAQPAKYTVKSGDSLSTIAKRVYKNPNFWPVLYWANHSQIRYANMIEVGQVLTVPAKPAHAPAAPSVLGPTPPPAPAHVATSTSATSYSQPSAPSYAAQAPVQSAPVQSTTYSGGSSYQQCVIARESGGNSQVMNSSGHYGLYQFSSGTWSAYGGNPADFGHASVAEQNQVFNNAIAAGGQSNWSPYDGC